MRYILAIALSLSLSAFAFAQDNSSNTAVSQQDLNTVFQTGTTVTQQNVLNKQESKKTVGGSACYTFFGTDNTAYQICI